MPENQDAERDQDVVAYSSFSGLRNDVTRERFSAGDLEVADNIDIDVSGRISRRDGFTLQQAGATHSLWADPQQTICLYAQGNVLYSMSTNSEKTALVALKSATPISYFKVNDRVYFSNGVDTGVIEQGAVRSWGVVPPTLPAITMGVGQMPAGTYQVTMTYVRTDGQESGAPEAAIVQMAADGGSLQFSNIPVSADPDVIAKNIYISPTNGEQLMLALVLANAATTASYANDATELDVPLESQFLVAAPAGQIVSFYRGRMWVAVGDLLLPSQPFDYERFDLREYIPMDGRITLLGPVTDKEMFADSARSSGFYIGTDRSCGILVGADPSDFKYIPKMNYGAVPGSMAMVDGSLFQDGSAGARELPVWLTTQGICVGMVDFTIKNLTRTRFNFDVGQQGAAVFLTDPNRFIATSST